MKQDYIAVADKSRIYPPGVAANGDGFDVCFISEILYGSRLFPVLYGPSVRSLQTAVQTDLLPPFHPPQRRIPDPQTLPLRS